MQQNVPCKPFDGMTATRAHTHGIGQYEIKTVGAQTDLGDVATKEGR